MSQQGMHCRFGNIHVAFGKELSYIDTQSLHKILRSADSEQSDGVVGEIRLLNCTGMKKYEKEMSQLASN